jgi:hypothetical protein
MTRLSCSSEPIDGVFVFLGVTVPGVMTTLDAAYPTTYQTKPKSDAVEASVRRRVVWCALALPQFLSERHRVVSIRLARRRRGVRWQRPLSAHGAS